ncbi:MAG: hypothetical protein Q4C87_02810 [Actinomycetaceae bacterium]|nr:hypothetical protein [Actinomycetaceae bacterium]
MTTPIPKNSMGELPTNSEGYAAPFALNEDGEEYVSSQSAQTSVSLVPVCSGGILAERSRI